MILNYLILIGKMKYFLTLFGVKNNVVENLTVTQFVIHDGGE